MCEQYVARAARPFRIDELWDFTAELEQFGIAGFGWGASWLADDGVLHSHRDIASFADDGAGRAAVGRQQTTSLLVHLRRPSKLSTLGLPDTQPFDDPAGRFACSHNGDLRHVRDLRDRYLAAGRIHGRADSEVGARWLEDHWEPGAATKLLESLHRAVGGHANLALITADGDVHHYAGNDENPVFTFRLGELGLASTGIYSLDRSLFTFVAPTATDRRMVGQGLTVSLAVDGSAGTNPRAPRTLVATA